jgi:hypothetical protein
MSAVVRLTKQPSVGVDRDMALAADDLLAGVIAARLAMRRFDRLAVDHRSRRACFATLPFPIEHEFDVMDRLEQEAPRQFAEPAVDRPPMAEMHGQHPPAAARAPSSIFKQALSLTESQNRRSYRARISDG